MRAPEPHDVVAVNLDPQADNRIHDDEVAQRYGFRGALVPGVELFALATVPFVRAWGESWLAGGALSLRFRKPVYDGERVVVTADPAGEGAYDVRVQGPDGTVRSAGVAHPPAPQRLPALPSLPAEAPLPAELRAAPAPGPFGTVVQPRDPAGCRDYVAAIGDPCPLYDDVVHPGLLLRLVNLALMRNVVLGAWIHTASDCRFLNAARVDEPLAVRSEVTEVFERRGHGYVRYDALVVSGDRPVVRVDHEAIWRLSATS